MKKLVLRFALPLLLSFVLADSQAQQILDIQAYAKMNGTRVTVLLSNNTVQWYTPESGWKPVPLDGLNGKKLVKLGVYVKTSIGDGATRLVGVADDNSIWWYGEGKPWERVPTSGLPASYTTKIFTPYFKPTSMGWSGETRYLLVQNDNSMFVYLDDRWERVPTEGLPAGYDFKALKSYQKYNMMGGSETRYIGVLRDNSIWWTSGKKWEKLERKGLTEGVGIAFFDVYMKFSMMGQPEGRLVCMQDDGTFWFLAVNSGSWKKLENTGLPANYKVKQLRVYQKYASGESGRLLAVLEDNTIWWFTEGKGWTQVDTKTLGLK